MTAETPDVVDRPRKLAIARTDKDVAAARLRPGKKNRLITEREPAVLFDALSKGAHRGRPVA